MSSQNSIFFLCVSFALTHAAGALAESADSESASRSTGLRASAPVWTFRFGLPFTGVLASPRGSRDEYRVNLAGVSVSARLLDLLEVEVALPYWIDPCVHGPAITPRLGVSPSLVQTSSWNVRVPVLATYSYGLMSGGGCDVNPDERFHLVGAAVGLDTTYERFNMRLLPFAGMLWNEVLDDRSSQPRTRGLGFGVNFEIGFRLPPPRP